MKYNKLINLEFDDSPLMDGEQLIWKGKPKKSFFILSDIVAVIPFVLMWMVFDGFMIGAFFLNMTKE